MNGFPQNPHPGTSSQGYINLSDMEKRKINHIYEFLLALIKIFAVTSKVTLINFKTENLGMVVTRLINITRKVKTILKFVLLNKLITIIITKLFIKLITNIIVL